MIRKEVVRTPNLHLSLRIALGQGRGSPLQSSLSPRPELSLPPAHSRLLKFTTVGGFVCGEGDVESGGS